MPTFDQFFPHFKQNLVQWNFFNILRITHVNSWNFPECLLISIKQKLWYLPLKTNHVEHHIRRNSYQRCSVKKVFLRRAYAMKFFFHRWLNFSFDSFLSTFNSVYSCEMWMKFFNLQSWKCFRRKNFYQIFDKIFSSEIHFTNQRSNIYWKWRKWLMWGEHERRNA